MPTGATPQGYNAAAAIAAVQGYANEPNLPSTAVVLGWLNKGLEEVCRLCGGPRLTAGYSTVNLQTTIVLNDDVQSIMSANFSMGSANASNLTGTLTPGSASPFAQGALVYPMEQLDQKTFMDAAAGFPAVGFGPPQAFFLFQDAGAAPYATLPAPVQPQLSTTTGTSTGSEIEIVITYTNENGETTPSPAADYTPTTVQQVVVATPQSYSNASGYNVYAGAVGGPYYLQNTSGPTAIGSSYTLPYPVLVTGTTPPSTNTATGVGTGGALSMQLYPAAMIGQVNIYYRARPLLFADATTESWTNLDTMAQEAAVLFAVSRVLANRGRRAEWMQLWAAEYKEMIDSLKESLNTRTTAKSGRVRDVTNRSFPSAPFWLR